MKYLARYIIIILSSFSLLACTASNVKVHHVKDKNNQPTNMEGVYYCLPKTVITVALDFVRTDASPGKYYLWGNKFPELGISKSSVIEKPSTTFKFANASIGTRRIPDPENIYFVELEASNFQRRNFSITLAEDCILSKGASGVEDLTFEFAAKILQTSASIAGSFISPVGDERAISETKQSPIFIKSEYEALKKKELTIQEKKQKVGAKETRDKIILIRNLKEKLILSENNVKNGEGLQIKLKELTKLENSYLQKFTGSKKPTTIKLNFEFIPEKTDFKLQNNDGEVKFIATDYLTVYTEELIPSKYVITQANIDVLSNNMSKKDIIALTMLLNKKPSDKQTLILFFNEHNINKKFHEQILKEAAKNDKSQNERAGIMIIEDHENIANKNIALPPNMIYKVKKENAELHPNERYLRLAIYIDSNQMAKIVEPSKSELDETRGWYYRVPAEATARLEIGTGPKSADNSIQFTTKKVIKSDSARVSQAGFIHSLPSSLGTARSKYEIVPHDGTGAIKTLSVNSEPADIRAIDSLNAAQGSIVEGIQARRKKDREDENKDKELEDIQREVQYLEACKQQRDLNIELGLTQTENCKP